MQRFWTGRVEGPQKSDCFAAVDVLVLPSFSENFGIVVEAMIAGRACVIARGVAVADAIAGAGAVLMTEPDPPSIACALSKLLGKQALRWEMGTRARELAHREYSSTVMAKRLVELYSSIARPAEFARQVEPMGDAIAPLSEQQRSSEGVRER